MSDFIARCTATALSALILCGAEATAQKTTEAVPAQRPTAAFTAQVEVNLSNLYITVLDRNGQPIKGLGPDRFSILEGDTEVEITNFVEIDKSRPRTGVPEERVGPEGAATETEASRFPWQAEHLVFLFDNLSLQERNRKRVIKALQDFVKALDPAVARRIMIAEVGRGAEVVMPFTSDPELIKAALKTEGKRPTSGEMFTSTKRILQRDIASAKLSRSRRVIVLGGEGDAGGGGGGGGDGGGTQAPSNSEILNQGDFGAIKAQQFLGQLDAIRFQHYDRIRRSLLSLDDLVRSLSGVPGRKDVVWIGEDLALRPAIDVYRTFYQRFSQVERNAHIEKPEIWAQETDLTAEYQFVAAGAQAASTSLHIIDASDRDRNMTTTDMGSTDIESFTSVEGGSINMASGYEVGAAQDLVEGSLYLAGATGGSSFSNSRNFVRFFDDLEPRLDSYYSIGYRRPAEPDGRLHSIRVSIEGLEGGRLHYHKKVLAQAEAQLLADQTLSRLRLDAGSNDLEMEVSLGEAVPTDEGQVIRPVRLKIPARNLVLVPEGAEEVGQVLVVLQSRSATGAVFPPQVMELTIRFPSDRVSPLTTTSATLRLLMNPDTTRVAVGVRDALSGTGATVAVDMEGDTFDDALSDLLSFE